MTCLPPHEPALPTMAVPTDRAARIAVRAEELARLGREDQAAVAELHELARGRRRTLAEAAQLLRVNGEYLEVRWRNRAVRLLTAAVTGHPVKIRGPSSVRAAGSARTPGRTASGARFQELARREPRLLALRDSLRPSPSSGGRPRSRPRCRGPGAVHDDLDWTWSGTAVASSTRCVRPSSRMRSRAPISPSWRGQRLTAPARARRNLINFDDARSGCARHSFPHDPPIRVRAPTWG